MILPKSRAIRIVLLVTGLTLVGYHIRQRVWATSQPQVHEIFPPGGRVMGIDTGGKVPGDPQNAVEDMHLIRKLIEIYKERHNRLPKGIGEIVMDIRENAQPYGFSDFMEARAKLSNPDNRFADWGIARKIPEGSILYYLSDKRPDGSMVGTIKAPGTRDVVVYTDIYKHYNTRHFKGERSTSNPVGFFVVLWDDDKVEKISYDRQLFVPRGKGRFTLAFPGQAGVPANALSYDEFYRLSGWKKGPRGEEGGKGQSFNGKLPR